MNLDESKLITEMKTSLPKRCLVPKPPWACFTLWECPWRLMAPIHLAHGMSDSVKVPGPCFIGKGSGHWLQSVVGHRLFVL